jgi:hypothetical protein
MPQAPLPVVVPTAVPPIEQEHVKKALEASQTAMDAISTVTAISTYTLTILGVIIAILALWGVGALVRAARSAAKQIANARFNAYIESDEFKEMVKVRIEKSVQDRWQNTIVVSLLAEDVKAADDPSPFPTGDAK